ncbi:putative ribonuclease H-like domain-containing protein [Tanacetum coccineum]
MVKPIWNNAQRVNHQNFAKKTHPCAKKNLVPRAVLMKSGLVSINTARQNISKIAVLVNTARQVNAAHSKTTMNAARPMSYLSKTAHSTVKRPIHKNTTFKNSNINQRVNTVRGKNFNTARPKAVVNAVKENNFNAVKASTCWVWKPKHKVLDHGNPQMDLQDQGVIDSGCSRHMTGNMSYLTDYEEIDGGYVAFGGNPKERKITGKIVSQMCDKKNSVLFNDTECIVLSPNFKLIDESQVLLRVPRKNNMYSVDLKNIVPKGGLTCLFAKATSDESKLWHRRLGHLNFKTMNKLVKGNLVRGLPSKIFENDQTYVACQKRKQHRASCKSKSENSISLPLHLLHMDLFGPTFVKSLMKKMYCLVVTDDFSRFTWVFFLATKDEISGILKSFITGIENLVDHKVKMIKCDNGTEFINREMNQFWKAAQSLLFTWVFFLATKDETSGILKSFITGIENLVDHKGILRQYSVARTPQQNGVAERRNRILIEAARTMLADSNDDGKKVDEDPRKDSECNDQEKEDNVNSTNTVNAASTNKVNAVGGKTSIKLPVDLDIPELEYPIPTTRIHKDHPLDQVIGDLQSAPQTRRMLKNLEAHGFVSTIQQRTNHKDLQNCLFACFLSQEFLKKVIHALKDPSWIKAMQEELLQFKLQEVWTLVDLPNGKRAIGTKWVFRNKNDERGIVIRNKARLVAQGLSLIEYNKDEKALYGLHQAPIAAYTETLFNICWLDNEFQIGKIDKTLFIKMYKESKGLQGTPIETQKPLLMDEDGEKVDVHIFDINGSARNKTVWVQIPQQKLNMWLLQVAMDKCFGFRINYLIMEKAKKSVRLIMEKLVIRENRQRVLVRKRIERVGENKNRKRDVWNKNRQSDLVSKRIERNVLVKNWIMWAKFLMYPRFVQVFVNQQLDGLPSHKRIYVTPSHTKKIFRNMKKVGKGFSGRVTPLFPTMVVHNQEEMGEGSAMPTDLHHTPTIIQPSTSQPKRLKKPRGQEK